jgi:hypothetical protein
MQKSNLASGMTHSDENVFDAILSELIVNTEFPPAVGADWTRKSDIVLDDQSYGRMSDRLARDENIVSVGEVPKELRADLVRRNSKEKRRRKTAMWELAERGSKT